MLRLFDLFRRAGQDLYLVGGAVRDRVSGKALEQLEDLDFATSAPRRTLPPPYARRLQRAPITPRSMFSSRRTAFW